MLLCVFFIGPVPSGAQLDEAVEESVRGATEGAASQRQVEALDDETRELLAEYRTVVRNAGLLEAYIESLRRLIADQRSDIRRLEEDLERSGTFERSLLPAMERMVAALDRFIRADLPFLAAERRERVARLKSLMSRSDVASSEKFRQLMEAYRIESDYGRTIEAYRGAVAGAAEHGRIVDFLRVGRVLLAYQTLDGEETAVWDAAAAGWRPLDGEYRSGVRRGLRIARKQAPPDLLVLPFSAPVDLEGLR